MARHAGQRRRADAVADPDRRRLLKAGLGAAGAIAAAGTLAQTSRASPVALDMTSTGPDAIPRRPLGRTGQQVSILGLGGYHLGTVATATAAIRLVHEAVDAGVRFFDNAWEYNGGRSEEWMGQALHGRRDEVFLMTKVCTHGRDRKTAMRQLEESLKRLRTDHLDLWQRSEEHTSELQSLAYLVCRLLLEKKKKK